MNMATGKMQTGKLDTSERGEQLSLLRESAGKFCKVEVHVGRSRRLRGTTPGYDRDVWRQLAELGWLGIHIPERLGGLGLGSAEMAVICEAAGRALFPEPIVASVMASGAILHGDNESLKKALLPIFVSGDLLPAFAWREEGHQCDLFSVNTIARHVQGKIELSGTKMLVVGGAGADGYVVSARSDAGIALYWLPGELAAPGLSHIELADGRTAVELRLGCVSIPDKYQIARPGLAESVLLRIYDEALINTSAELLGVLSRAFEITLDYLRTRVQFGKLIGSYQALQHRAADLYAVQLMSRCALNEVLEKVGDVTLTPEARGALASRVKARCADSSLRVTREAIQMHGAIGFSDECDVGLYLKRAVTLSAWLGGGDVQRRRFARLAPQADHAEAEA